MPIVCKICEKVFEKLITPSHLKGHGIDVKTYKSMFGEDSITSQEYKKERSLSVLGENNPNFGKSMDEDTRRIISKKNSGKVAWNKGIKFEDTTKFKETAEKRERRYSTGELRRREYGPLDEDVKNKISASIMKYAASNGDELSARAKRAISTKMALGYDIAPFRGRHHSENTKNRLRELLSEFRQERSRKTLETIKSRAESLDIGVLAIDGLSVKLECRKCDTQFSFTKQYFTDSKFFHELCPTCHPRDIYRSGAEQEIFNYVNNLGFTCVANKRFAGIGEVDIFLPDKKLCIEYNGLYWHSEEVLTMVGKSKTADLEKKERLEQLGYRVITIFEDEWIHKRLIVQSRIRHILNMVENRVYARNTTVVELSSKDAARFCDLYHIQGKARSNVRYGLLYNGDLVAVMTFSKNNISRKISHWEINRFCTLDGITVIGGASKLFNHFIKTHQPDCVVSYADRRWSNGGLYEKLGFSFVKNTGANYWYVPKNQIARIHRFTFRTRMRDGINESGLVKELGLLKVWDCGSSKWIWKGSE